MTCADGHGWPRQAGLYASDLLTGHGSGAAIELEAPQVRTCRYLRSGWHRTASVRPRSAGLCGLGGSLLDLLDRAEDHRRGALDRPAHQVPRAVAGVYLGEPPVDPHGLAVRAGGHVAARQHAGQYVRCRGELITQDVGESCAVP